MEIEEHILIRSFRGKTPKVHPKAFISEFAYVIGDVEIGENSSIWPGTVVRGDGDKITIGKNTNVQDNSVIHSGTIGDGVTIGHNVTWHGTRVGDNCLIGNGATVNSRVEVGDLCIVASGAVVLPNEKVTSGSFMAGVPATVQTKVTERHKKMIKGNALGLVKQAQFYKEEGLE
ncbi:MAG: Carbonic anhydrase or acetyltransferase, isoleucine patch superfamily [Chloroflexi bacterium]|jgi:carbonic anhydrase/acetyltransferase-like protein (isoleucine patch superfamily)|nr:MAG: Carbonic anhydrase or acetyltransferase, isoleucine patch superfamily [Chloroflexota bacterium]